MRKLKYSDYKTETKVVDIRTLTPHPNWKELDEEMDWRLNRGRNEDCWCGSEKKYKKCCMNKRPIEQLEHLGHKVLKDDDGKVIVLVGKSEYIGEGFNSPMEITQDNIIGRCEIDEEQIKDYNSLWYMTYSGWWNINPNHPYPIYPMINVDGKWWRWDNSLYLRPKCMTFKWSKKNMDLFLQIGIQNHLVKTDEQPN